MSPGLAIAWIVTAFGLIAGGAVVAGHVMPNWNAPALQLSLAFAFCTAAGLTAGLMFAPRAEAAPLMQVAGYALLALGVAAGALAMAALLDLFTSGRGTLPLWIVFAGSLPVGVLLAMSGVAVAGAGQRE